MVDDTGGKTDQDAYSPNHPLLQNVKLIYYCENQHGFLKITLERNRSGIELTGEYYTIPHQIEPQVHATRPDRFSYSFRRQSSGRNHQ